MINIYLGVSLSALFLAYVIVKWSILQATDGETLRLVVAVSVYITIKAKNGAGPGRGTEALGNTPENTVVSNYSGIVISYTTWESGKTTCISSGTTGVPS